MRLMRSYKDSKPSTPLYQRSDSGTQSHELKISRRWNNSDRHESNSESNDEVKRLDCESNDSK